MAAPGEEPLNLLICGIPASGKSNFGRWLKKECGFAFIELEANEHDENSLDRSGLRESCERFWRGEDVRSFPNSLFRLGPSVAVEWGFPVNLLHVVVALKSAGLMPWWFDGDRLAARQHFIGRDGRPPELFDHQFGAISAVWCSIEEIVERRIIRTVHPNGTFETQASVHGMIIGASS